MKPFSHLKVAALSDVGRKRKNNEDAFGTFPEAGVFCVADGMGGGDDGEIASAAVVRSVEEVAGSYRASETGGYAAQDVSDGVSRALSKASAWICNRAHERKLNGCGSTFVGVVFDVTDPARALAVHAGDSRLYLLHGRSIRQITRDHSVAEMIGEKDESKVNPMFRSMVVNGIGIRPKADPEVTPFKVTSGDRVLICSDGLSRMVPDKKMLAISRGADKPAEAVKGLIAAALEAGGVDNVTVVLVEIGELPKPLARLEVPAELLASDDAETADSPTSEGGETTGTTGNTGSTQTLSTMTAGFSEDTAFGESEECDPKNDVVRASVFARMCTFVKAHLPMCISVALGAILLLAGVIVWACHPWTIDHDQVQGRPEPAGPARASSEIVKSAKLPAPPQKKPAAAEKPVKAASKTPLRPPQAVPRSAAAPSAVPSVPAPVPVSATNAAPVVAPPKPDPSLQAFASACEEKSAKQFVQTVRRLWPKDGVKLDFDEEAEHFLKSARQFARMRGVRDAEAAAVDLRVLILNAEPVRAVLASRRSEAAFETVLTDWSAVLKGDPTVSETRAACARLVKKLPEIRVR